MLQKLIKFYKTYLPYIRTDLWMYIIMILIIGIGVVVIVLRG